MRFIEQIASHPHGQPIEDLAYGDTFRYEDQIWIKSDDGDSDTSLCVCLEDGECRSISYSTLVTEVNKHAVVRDQ